MREWKNIDTAPKDREVVIRIEDGEVWGRMRFSAPHFWNAPSGFARFTDKSLYPGGDPFWDKALKATHWSPE